MQPKKGRARRPRPAAPNPFSEIAPGVFVGGWKEALQFEGSRFCVLDEAPEDMPAATHIRIYDEAADRVDVPSLDRLAQAMRSARDSGRPVMVFCGQGRYRSPLGAMWYLRRAEGLSLADAYERVHAVRPASQDPRKWAGNASELDRA